MENEVVWGIHTGRPRGSKDSEPRVLAAEVDRLFKGGGGRGIVAVAWPETGDLGGLPAEPDAFERHVGAARDDAEGPTNAIDAATLFAFACEAKDGDIVVWRSAESDAVWIGRIRGPYRYVPDAPSGYVHQRPVSWRPPRPTTDFSKEALRALGQHRTFFQVRNAIEELRQAATGNPTWMLAQPAEPAAVPEAAIETELERE